MKKFSLLLMTTLFFIVSFTEEIFAISYNNTAVRIYPNTPPILDGRYNFFWYAPPNITTWYSIAWLNNIGGVVPYADNTTPCLTTSNTIATSCYVKDTTYTRSTFWEWLELEPINMASWTLYRIWWIWAQGNNGLNIYAKKFWPAWNTGGTLRINFSYTDNITGAQYLNYSENGTWLTLWSVSYSSGSLPNRFAMYYFAEFARKRVLNGSAYDRYIYMREFWYCMYITDWNGNYCQTISLVSDTFPEGLPYSINQYEQFAIGNGTNWAVYRFTYIPKPEFMQSAWNKQRMLDFVTWTWSQYLTTWYGWNNISYYYTNPTSSSWSSSSWTWSTWSQTTDITQWWYSQCDWFTDFGCYISSTVSGFFGYFIPDISINWYGQTTDCNEYVLGGSGAVISQSGTTSLDIFQRFANVISSFNPFPPLDDGEVCLITGETKTLSYPPHNAFSILIIILCIIPIFFSLHHNKKDTWSK